MAVIFRHYSNCFSVTFAHNFTLKQLLGNFLQLLLVALHKQHKFQATTFIIYNFYNVLIVLEMNEMRQLH